MNKAFATLFLLVIGLMLSQLRAQPAAPTAPPAGGAAAVPTTQQIQQMLDAKQYADVLKQSQRVLQLKGPAAKGIEKYDYLMLRAEAQLALKQQGPAAESYRDAIKETSDPTKAGVPKAMITLLQKSKGFMYSPKPSNDPTKPAAPLNIIDPAERKTALAALFDDEWKPTQAKIDALKKRGTSLPPILEASTLAGEMRGLEIAATGSDTQTSTALTDLTDSASKLMTDYLDRNAKRVEDIDRAANLPASDNINETARRGLTASQTKDLKEISDTCEKLNLAAQQVSASAGPKGSEFKSIADRAADLGKRAKDILTADYSQIIDPNANRPVQRGPGMQHPQAPPQRTYK